jgi:hypothetical protein
MHVSRIQQNKPEKALNERYADQQMCGESGTDEEKANAN